MVGPSFCWGDSSPGVALTFGDDPAIRERNVLGTAAGDADDWGVQAHTLLEAHGQEGQLGQVVPKGPHDSHPGSKTRNPPPQLHEICLSNKINSRWMKYLTLIKLCTLNRNRFLYVNHTQQSGLNLKKKKIRVAEVLEKIELGIFRSFCEQTNTRTSTIKRIMNLHKNKIFFMAREQNQKASE